MAADDGSVVLRIKRKRTEDPLDALLVAQVLKKPYIAKNEECAKETTDLKHNDLTSTVERVFKFVGSVPQGDDVKKKDLLAKIHKQSISHEKLAKSHIHNQQTIQDRLRQQKKLLNQEARFKVISSNRENEADLASQSDSHSRLTEEEHKTDAASEEAVDDVDLEVQRLLSVYDLVKDEDSIKSDSKRQERLARKAKQTEDVNAILCNSVKMIREKLTVSEEPKTDQKKSDKEGYVYDFYYPSDNFGRLGDIVEVLPFDSDLVHETLEGDFGEIYDDEDDSNDEGNWRNDYPDEDEQWSDSSQDRKFYEDYGFDSDEGYRRHAFDEDLSDDED
ncbi:putative RNA polymerase II nuclear localization protein SLC7A6OS isoform X2 [Oculina patagonica]